MDLREPPQRVRLEPRMADLLPLTGRLGPDPRVGLACQAVVFGRSRCGRREDHWVRNRPALLDGGSERPRQLEQVAGPHDITTTIRLGLDTDEAQPGAVGQLLAVLEPLEPLLDERA